MVVSAVAGVAQAAGAVNSLRAKQSFKGAAALPRVAPAGTRVVASRRSSMSELPHDKGTAYFSNTCNPYAQLILPLA